MFRFGEPQYLYALLLIPLLAGIFYFALWLRSKRLAAFGKKETVSELVNGVSQGKIKLRFVLFLTGIVFVIFALARPQLGAKLKEVSRTGFEVIFAVDVSNSMLAEDYQPNRLERTKNSIIRLLNDLGQENVGLVVFAGDAYVQLPVTSDYLSARNFISQLSPDMVSRQGTAIGAAIDLASISFSSETEGSRVIIVISDGENHEDDPVAAATQAAEKGITIYCIGIGTPEGAPIPYQGDFIRDEQGNIVVSKLDEGTLERIALATGGAYIRATNASLGLTEIVERINETGKREYNATVFDSYDELYRYPLAAGLIFLLMQMMISPAPNRLWKVWMTEKSQNKA